MGFQLSLRSSVRFIEYDEDNRPNGYGGREVVCHVAGPIPSPVMKDPAGYYFHLRALQQAGLWEDPAEAEAEAAAAAAEAGAAASPSGAAASADDKPPPGVEWKGSKARKRKQVKKKETDPYALLGLSNERWTATEAQIRAAYRKVCLEAHPDKALVNVTDEAEKERIQDHFKLIQDAYDTLSDKDKRREFDSIDEFDDTLPTQCDPKDFFKVFGPAFRRNSRWSEKEGVPDVGDEATSWEDVCKFYDFWYTFKSWREFPHPDEEDVEAAESREHRRWIERNNSKLREKGKKDEGRRLREFVDAAYKYDPRVARKKEDDRLERERKKAEKEEARRRVLEEEEARKAAAEAAKRAVEEEAKRQVEEARKVREAAKAQSKQVRKRLRIIAEGADGKRLASEDEVEKLTQRMEAEALAALVDTLCGVGGAPGSAEQQAELRALLDQALRGIDTKEEEAARAREAARKEAELAAKAAAREEHRRKMAAMREWTEEELRLLDKACNKFPMGTPKRWEAVAGFVRTRTLEEVLLMVKDRQGASATRMKAQEDWKGAQKNPAAVRAQADTRAQAFTDVEVTLEGEAQALIMPASTTTTPAAPAAAKPAAAKPAAAKPAAAKPAAAAAASTASGGGGGAVANGAASTTSTASAAPAAPAAAPAAAPTAAAPEAAAPAAAAAAAPAAPVASDATSAAAGAKAGKKAAADSPWTEAQELALVAALKQCPKELGAERWDAVAKLVPGRSKAQCFKRFKELREAFRSKKGAGGAGGADGDDGDE